MDGGAWWAAVHGVAKSWIWLGNFTFTCHFHALEKETAAHSSVLPWRIPWTREPGGLPSMRSHRVGHDWSDLATAPAASIAHRVLDFCEMPSNTQKSRLWPQNHLGLFKTILFLWRVNSPLYFLNIILLTELNISYKWMHNDTKAQNWKPR